MLRVHTVAELFDAAETLARSRVPAGNRLAILTNGGGPGVLATDSLITQGEVLAELRPQTRERLEAKLGSAWSRDNPVDILADARGDRYAAALEALLADRGADAVLVLQRPPRSRRVSTRPKRSPPPRTSRGCPCWRASWAARAANARRWLVEHGVPSYDTPRSGHPRVPPLGRVPAQPRRAAGDAAVGRARRPRCDRDAAGTAIERALEAGREWLLDQEAAAVLAAYGVTMAGGPAPRPGALALAVGLFSDPTFGPVLFCGASRSALETESDGALALPPLNPRWRATSSSGRARRRRSRGDGASGAAFDAVAATLVRVSQIAIDHGAIVELEVDPLLSETRAWWQEPPGCGWRRACRR